MKQYFITIDTETTQTGLVADFAAVVTDRKGNIVNQIAVLVHGTYDNPKDHPLFFTTDPDCIWSRGGQEPAYNRLLLPFCGSVREGQLSLD